MAILIAVPLNEARAQNHIDVIAPENSASENSASEKNSSDSEKSAQEDAGSENESAKSAAGQAPIKRQLYFFSDSGLTNGANLLKREKYTAALQVFQDILKRNPRNIDAVAGLGAAYLGMDQTKAAGDQIRKALARDNKHIGANYLLGRYYLDIDRPSQATEQLNVLYLLCGKQNCPEEAALEAEIDAARRK
ncbi:MAG: tetratricopeptide repeat protein [Pseudomonadota bacterium]